ncbi:MAG: hypothetical protein FJ362_03980 [Gemmatimonadetes bacterium]|nr:hypothetical protein [Gemmatimonadota bacterium]
MRLPLLASFLALPLVTGCHVSRPITGVPPAGVTVEAELSPEGTQRLTAIVGPNAARLDGLILAATGDSLTLSMREVRLKDGRVLFLQGTTVALDRAQLTALRGRTLDRRRTAIATGLGLIGAVLLIDQVRFGGGGEGGGTGGGTNPAVAPRRP